MSATLNINMIGREEYIDQKPYWDYQRKIEFNKEQLRWNVERIAEQLSMMTDEGEIKEIEIDVEDMFTEMWNRMPMEDYEDPPRNWIPANEKYQIVDEHTRGKPGWLRS
tara:strand:+ start:3070 stop:3396 length:327 start_codon:yes stop_codon:yes gene_type:complete